MTKPIAKLRDSLITATIWKNESKPDPESGEMTSFYSVDIKRSFKGKDDTWQETSSFTGAELLRVSNLAASAYNYILQLKSADKSHGQEAS